MDEIHIVIIWSKGLRKKEEILNDLKKKFQILDIYNISWSADNFANNLSRFYGENLPENSKKEQHCGNDTFCCIILKDIKPKYDSRNTSRGSKVVNVNLFDSKQLYRKWTDGGHKIHATDNILETRTQLALLFGKNYDDFLVKNSSDNIKEINYEHDLVGSKGWKSFDELFGILNFTSEYVVLRNFDNLEEQLNSKHPDVDILVQNQNLVCDILNAKKTTKESYRVQYNVIIDNKNINFDIRYIGDNYYDKFWEMDILETKAFHKKGFYIPNKENHFYSLIYHALIHKKNVSEDYNKNFLKLGANIDLEIDSSNLVEHELLLRLSKYLKNKRYDFVEPIDLTVYFNSQLISNICSIVVTLERTKEWAKPKFSTKIKREYKRILKQIDSLKKNKG